MSGVDRLFGTAFAAELGLRCRKFGSAVIAEPSCEWIHSTRRRARRCRVTTTTSRGRNRWTAISSSCRDPITWWVSSRIATTTWGETSSGILRTTTDKETQWLKTYNSLINTVIRKHRNMGSISNWQQQQKTDRGARVTFMEKAYLHSDRPSKSGKRPMCWNKFYGETYVLWKNICHIHSESVGNSV